LVFGFWFCFFIKEQTKWKKYTHTDAHAHESLQISLSWQLNVKLVLVYILQRGVHWCLLHVPEYLEPLQQKLFFTGEVKSCYFRLQVFGRPGTFALLSQRLAPEICSQCCASFWSWCVSQTPGGGEHSSLCCESSVVSGTFAEHVHSPELPWVLAGKFKGTFDLFILNSQFMPILVGWFKILNLLHWKRLKFTLKKALRCA